MAVSQRAQQILEAIERDAEERRRGLAATSPPPPARAPERPAPPQADAPLHDDPVAAPATQQLTTDDLPNPARLVKLVEEVAGLASDVRARARSLQESLDLIALSVGLPPEPGTAAPEAEPAPAVSRRAQRRAEREGHLPGPPVAALPPRYTPKEPVTLTPPEPTVAAEPAPALRPGITPAPAPAATAVVSDSARLIAVEMAVAGFTRNEVAQRLASEYGIADATPVLDDVFGSGTSGDSRMPWT